MAERLPVLLIYTRKAKSEEVFNNVYFGSK